MLRSVRIENLASQLLSTLLSVVLVSQVFFGRVGFVLKVGFGSCKVDRLNLFSLASVL